MATKIQAMGDTIKVGQAFVSGKDRIFLNDQMVFEGKLQPGVPEKFTLGVRSYTVEKQITSKMMNLSSFAVEIYENEQLMHSGIYDQQGKQAASQAEAKANAGAMVCGMIGAVAGVVTMSTLNITTQGAVPGGAIGGGIGGGLGGAVGYGIGQLIFGRGK